MVLELYLFNLQMCEKETELGSFRPIVMHTLSDGKNKERLTLRPHWSIPFDKEFSAVYDRAAKPNIW